MSQQLLAVTAPQTSYTQREGYVFDKKISTSMRGLKELFSDPTLATPASFRCSTEEPSDIDIMFESIFPEENGEYKQWIKRLYNLGLIRRLPDESEIVCPP